MHVRMEEDVDISSRVLTDIHRSTMMTYCVQGWQNLGYLFLKGLVDHVNYLRIH